MRNTIRRKRQANKSRGMAGSLLLVVAAMIVVIFISMPEKQKCMSDGCDNSRCEEGVYCTKHRLEFEEYKDKAYNYKTCTVTYSTETLQCDVEHSAAVTQYEPGEK